MPVRPPVTALRASSIDERRHRLYLASEAAATGHSGIALVAAASGTSVSTDSRDVTELAGDPVFVNASR
ncbi:hypothetical protein GCM10010345_69770 [Streptomyces canarius]|uniref:Uncharacterized protein n=2 Tax=Streptomyces TaxID=1883 RepID=A0ABQ3D2G3_9ACTN|nr:hypothetical protein GCM10010345_69770 [Streptomyces canarius]